MSAVLKETGHVEHPYIGGRSRRGPRPKLLTEESLRALYGQGMSQREIADRLDTTQRTVSVFMARFGIEARPAIKREQRGAANSYWHGDEVGYIGAHQRVYRARGRPMKCEHCGRCDEGKYTYHWANVSGHYEDPHNYIRLCVSCHRKFDDKRRGEKL